MRKLLTAAFLVGGCTLHQANAQKATLPRKTLQKATTAHQATTGLPPTTVTEFCLNYPRYYFDLPAQYRENAYYRFKAAGLTLRPDTGFTTELAKSSALREVAYKSLYEYCIAIKFMYSKSADEILFVYLYELLHMNTGPATILTLYCKQHYQRPLASVPLPSAPYQAATTNTLTESRTVELDSPQPIRKQPTTAAVSRATVRPLYPAKQRLPNPSTDLEADGWRFEAVPLIEAASTEVGLVRFKVKISSDGQVESASKVTSSTSPEQVRRCLDKLLDTQLIKTKPEAGRTTGYCTFKWTWK